MELHLPEETIQCIQSFLNAKEAAQTTLLSKSWHSAWLNRPSFFYFDQQRFASDDDDFWKYVNNTLQRYEKLKLNIHSLKLCILHAPPEPELSLVNKLIITALELGATDLDFKIYSPNCEFTLPNQVFAFQDLSRLSVSGCQIGVGGRLGTEVVCKGLKSLALESVYVKKDAVIWDIITRCPSIEEFSMSLIKPGRCFLFLGDFHDGINLCNAFHKLKSLSVHGVYLCATYFDDLSSIFPCLEALAIHNSILQRPTKISSSSLRCITYEFDSRGTLRSEFAVPRIKNFTFSGLDVPVLLFGPTEGKWESSNISILSKNPPHGGWFLRLRELLKNLSPSKVSLQLKFLSKGSYIGSRDFRDVTDKPEVENLEVIGPVDLDSDIFKSLLQCCRPIYVSQCAFPKNPKKSTAGEEEEKEEYDFSKTIQIDSFLNSCTAYQMMTKEEEGESHLKEEEEEEEEEDEDDSDLEDEGDSDLEDEGDSDLEDEGDSDSDLEEEDKSNLEEEEGESHLEKGKEGESHPEKEKGESHPEEEEGESHLEEVCEEYYDRSVSAWLPRSLDTSSAAERIRLHLKWSH